MKSLELNQMENLEGGNWLDWTCVGVAVVGVAATVLSVGGAAGVAVVLAGSFCTGWGMGRLL